MPRLKRRSNLIRRRPKGMKVQVAEMQELQPKLKRRKRFQMKKKMREKVKPQRVRLLRRKKIKVNMIGSKGQVLSMPMINAEGGLNTGETGTGKRSAITGDLNRNLKGIGKSYIDSLTKVK